MKLPKFSKHNKEPQKHSDGADLIRRIEIKRKTNILVEKFYPALVNASTSIEEARMLVQATASLIMESVMETMKERKFKDIAPQILKKLSPNGEREAEVKVMLDAFDEENLFVAREIIEGMTGAITQMINDEMQGRKLDTFKPNWDKMLNK